MKRLWAAVAVLSLVTACGSTVQVTGTAVAGGSQDGLSAPGGGAASPGGSTLSPDGLGGSTGAAGPGTSGASGTPGSVAGPVGTGGATGGSVPAGGTTGTATVGRGPESGRGFTKTTISLGVATANDYNNFVGSTGLKGVSYEGDTRVWFQAVVNQINSHGGLLGRKVVLVPHDFSTAQELSDTAAANQAACVTWTQDHPVFAVLFAGFIVDDTLLKCLGKAQTPLVYPGAGLDYPLHYQQTYRQYPLFFNLAQMVGDDFDRVAIARLTARGFFGPWDTRNGRPGTTAANPTRIGIVGFDDPDGAVQLASEKKQLAANHLPEPTVVECPRSLQNKISCEQSAVLKFAAGGVTHVFGADTTFMKNASSQGYRPRYWIAVQAALFAANVDASQMTGAMSENYVPFTDVAAADYPGDPTPATTFCRKLMKAAGQGTTDPNTLDLQMSVCDEFFFVQAAVAKAGSLGQGALRTGMEALGSSVQSALTWTTFLGPARHTSVTALRDITYLADKSAFVYASSKNYS